MPLFGLETGLLLPRLAPGLLAFIFLSLICEAPRLETGALADLLDEVLDEVLTFLLLAPEELFLRVAIQNTFKVPRKRSEGL
jgi:hypothetical protein